MQEDITIPSGYFRFRMIDEDKNHIGYATLPMWEKPRVASLTTDESDTVVRISIRHTEVYYTDEPEVEILQRMYNAQQT